MTMFVAALAISGIPGLAGFLFEGRDSQSGIRLGAWPKPLYVDRIVSAAMTSVYMWRLMYMTFYGQPRSDVHAHESPKVMTLPLAVLAAGSALFGWLASAQWPGPSCRRASGLRHVADARVRGRGFENRKAPAVLNGLICCRGAGGNLRLPASCMKVGERRRCTTRYQTSGTLMNSTICCS